MCSLTGRQRRRLRALVERVRVAGPVYLRGCASERLALRACRVFGLVAVVSKSRPWMPRGKDRELAVFATFEEALSRYPRSAVMRHV